MGRIVIGGLFDNIDGINRTMWHGSISTAWWTRPLIQGPARTIQSMRPLSKPTAKSSSQRLLHLQRRAAQRDCPPQHQWGLDAAFKPGTGANGTLYAIVVQPDGRIVIGGDFTTFNEAPNTRIARLNANGTVEAGFAIDPVSQTRLSGADAPVRSIALQSDGKILLSGSLRENARGGAGPAGAAES